MAWCDYMGMNSEGEKLIMNLQNMWDHMIFEDINQALELIFT